MAPTANSTPFLCSCAKKRGGAPKKRAYGCRHGGCWVPPASPTDSKPQHHRRLRQADLSARSTHRVQVNLTHQFVPLGLTPNGRGGRAHQADVEASERFSLAARHRFFWQDKRNGVERQNKPTTPTQRIGAPVQSPDKHQPPAKVGRETSRPPTCSAHANGGAAKVKKALFFGGSTPFLLARQKKWGRKAGQALAPRPTYRRTRTILQTPTNPLKKSGEKRPVYKAVALTRMVEPPG